MAGGYGLAGRVSRRAGTWVVGVSSLRLASDGGSSKTLYFYSYVFVVPVICFKSYLTAMISVTS